MRRLPVYALFYAFLSFSISYIYSGCGDLGNPRPPELSELSRPSVQIPDREICRGDSVQIGPGTVNPDYAYSWSPEGSLDDPLIAQPLAAPVTTTAYTLSLVDMPTGVTNTAGTIVVVHPLPDPDIATDYQICRGERVLIGSPAEIGYQYDWTPSETLLSPRTSDTYAVPDATRVYYRTTTAMDTGCSSRQAVTVTVNPLPEGSITADTHSVCPGGMVDFNGSYSAAITYFSWDFDGDGVTDSTQPDPAPVSYPSPGSYPVRLRVIDSNGCAATESLDVTVHSPPSASISVSTSFTCTGTLADFDGSSSSEAGSATLTDFAWDFTLDGVTDATVADPLPFALSPGSYQVSLAVTDANGCTDSKAISYDVPPPPPAVTADAGEDQSIGTGGSTQFPGTARGGFPPYTYEWSPSTGLSEATERQPTVSLAAAGTYPYRFTVTDSYSCSATDEVILSVFDALIVNAGPDRYLCRAGDSTPIGNPAGGGSSPYAYSWTENGGVPATLDDPSIAVPTAAPVSTRLYEVMVTDSISETDSDQVYVYLPEAALAADAGPDRTVGLGGAIQIGSEATGGYPPYSYLWSPATGLDNPTIARPTASGAAFGSVSYTVTVYDSQGCSDEDSMILTVTEGISVDAGPDRLICGGDSARIGNPAGGGVSPYRYSWNPTGGLWYPDANSSSVMASPVTYTTYTESVVDSTGSSASDTVTVMVSPAVTADAGGDQVICSGEGVQIGNPCSGCAYYSWAPITGLDDPNLAQPTAGPSLTTIYTLTAQSAAGCADSDEVRVTVSSTPEDDLVPGTLPDLAGSDQVVCEGIATLIGRPEQAGYGYSWTPATGLDDPDLAQPSAVPATTTVYTLTVMNDVSGCSSQGEVEVFVNLNPTVDAGEDQNVCAGAYPIFNPYYDSNYSYFWSSSPTDSFLVGNENEPYAMAHPLTTTTYSLTVTHAVSGCAVADGDAITITVNMPPTADAGPDQNVCSGEGVSIGPGSSVSGLTYRWNPTSGLDNPNIHNPTASPVTALAREQRRGCRNWRCITNGNVTYIANQSRDDVG